MMSFLEKSFLTEKTKKKKLIAEIRDQNYSNGPAYRQRVGLISGKKMFTYELLNPV
jgi:hypothetical protein